MVLDGSLEDELLEGIIEVRSPEIPMARAKIPIIMKAIENRTVRNAATITGKKIAENPTPITKSPRIIAKALAHPDILVV